jgi:riboflavin kinase/FMN adenylyltransferase
MLLFNALSEVPAAMPPSAVTIGKFDGVHLGHQKLLHEVIDAAESAEAQSVVVTFDRHPDALLNPERAKLPLIGLEQKHQLLEAAGVAATLNLPFTKELAQLSPREFVQQILVEKLNAKVVLVGEGFRFGFAGAGDLSTLQELGQEFGFAAKMVGNLTKDGQKVSSTRIRELLDSGDVAGAARLLGRVHTTVGVIEHGLKIGRTIGFPTANMSREANGYLPVDGVYAGWLLADGQRYPAAHSVGINETFQAVPRLVESHVLDRNDLDFYDKVVTLEYVDFVRPSAKFAGVDELIVAINHDLDKVRSILGICYPA